MGVAERSEDAVDLGHVMTAVAQRRPPFRGSGGLDRDARSEDITDIVSESTAQSSSVMVLTPIPRIIPSSSATSALTLMPGIARSGESKSVSTSPNENPLEKPRFSNKT